MGSTLVFLGRLEEKMYLERDTKIKDISETKLSIRNLL